MTSGNGRWEYKLFESKDAGISGMDKRAKRTRLQAYLTHLGEEGWEIINIDFHDLNIGMSFVGVAKRPLDAGSAVSDD